MQAVKTLPLLKCLGGGRIFMVRNFGTGDRQMNDFDNTFWELLDALVKDSEIKILMGCTEEEKQLVYEAYNETQYMKGLMIRR